MSSMPTSTLLAHLNDLKLSIGLVMFLLDDVVKVRLHSGSTGGISGTALVQDDGSSSQRLLCVLCSARKQPAKEDKSLLGHIQQSWLESSAN